VVTLPWRIAGEDGKDGSRKPAARGRRARETNKVVASRRGYGEGFRDSILWCAMIFCRKGENKVSGLSDMSARGENVEQDR
jgi:hypothetical protein